MSHDEHIEGNVSVELPDTLDQDIFTKGCRDKLGHEILREVKEYLCNHGGVLNFLLYGSGDEGFYEEVEKKLEPILSEQDLATCLKGIEISRHPLSGDDVTEAVVGSMFKDFEVNQGGSGEITLFLDKEDNDFCVRCSGELSEWKECLRTVSSEKLDMSNPATTSDEQFFVEISDFIHKVCPDISKLEIGTVSEPTLG